MWIVGLFCALSIQHIRSDCPRAQRAQTPGGPPAFEPEEHFIQSSFIYRDLAGSFGHFDDNHGALDADREYSILVVETLRTLRQRLKTAAKVTVDNENLDCSGSGYPRCREFPPKDAFHFLVIEDANTGAVVYSLDRERNGPNPGRIENAILDPTCSALSRHSRHPLTPYASAQFERVVGFVREVGTADLEQFAFEHQALEDAERPKLHLRSPLELRLLNEHIVELRRVEPCERPVPGLTVYRAGQLHDLIDLHSSATIFCLFWAHSNALSAHLYQLWKGLAQRLAAQAEFRDRALFAVVPCHQELDLCTAFGIQHADYRTLFAIRGSRKFASQFGVGDQDFYTDWIRTILAGTLINIQDDTKLSNAKNGILDGFPQESLPRPAVTIGTFPEEDCDEFKVFRRVSSMLAGRYHFVYKIDPELENPTVSTFRPLERAKSRIDHSGGFTVKALATHVTAHSLPSLLNISHGFTSDIIYRAGKPTLLLLHDGDAELLTKFSSLSQKEAQLAHLDVSDSLPVKGLLDATGVDQGDLPLLCLTARDRFGCERIDQAELSEVAEKFVKDEIQVKPLAQKQPHPLKHIQLAHVNRVFGDQDVQLLADPLISLDHHHHFGHPVESADGTGGCPMMRHLNSMGRDEL